jgi:autotransporter-associated beta strand protein
MTKLGSETLTFRLNDSHLYSGTTNVSAGTLALSSDVLNNLMTSSSSIVVVGGATLDVTALPSQRFDLTSTQTLSGAGTIRGGVSFPSGSKIAPGSSTGVQTFSGPGNITLNNGVTAEMEIGAATPGSGHDQVLVSGSKSLVTNGAILKLLPVSGIVANTAYTLVDTSSGGSVDFSTVFKNLDGTTNLVEGGGPYTQGPLTFTVDYDSTFVKVTFTTVPEPSSFGLIVLGTAALMRRRSRR